VVEFINRLKKYLYILRTLRRGRRVSQPSLLSSNESIRSGAGGYRPPNKSRPPVVKNGGSIVYVPLPNISTKVNLFVPFHHIFIPHICDLYHKGRKWAIFSALYIVGE